MKRVVITLNQTEYAAVEGKVVGTGSDSFSLNAGDKLKIKAGDNEIFNEKVEHGKEWKVEIDLKVTKIDV